jgi:predicted dehydrogenase
VINVGIIGCGDVATHSYLPGLASLSSRARVVAVFDIVDERVNNAKAFHPEAVGYTDYNAFLAHNGGEKMDLVFNLTPAPLHRDITARALEAGYHVYSEKPIASSLEEAKELVEIAENKGLRFFCAPATLVTSRMLWLKEIMDEGTLGRPYFAKAHIAGMGPASWRTYSGDPRVFYTPKVGPMIDIGVYMLHTMTGLFGPARRIQAMGGIMNEERKILIPKWFGEQVKVETADLLSINIDFGDNRYGHLFNSFAVPASKSPMFEVYGSMGAVSVGREQWYNGSGTSDVYTRDESESGANEGWQDNVAVPNPVETAGILESGILHALDCLKNGTPTVLSAAHATHVLEIMLAVNKAIESGELIEITSTF